MKKILLIISREYLTRVKKRSFILLTFLFPLLFAAMYGVVGYIIFNQNKLSNAKKVEVFDESNVFKNQFKNNDNLLFYYTDKNFADVKKSFKTSGYDFILYIPAFTDSNPKGIQLLSEKQANFMTVGAISSKMENVLRNRKLLAAGIDTSKLNKINTSVAIETRIITDSGVKKSNSFAAYGVGFLFSFLIYMFIFLYGSQVMRGVIEEKTSRVIEVIISSVRPFQLMMGKIIGIALVGLTQFLLWIILTVGVSSIISQRFNLPNTMNHSTMSNYTIRQKKSVDKQTASANNDSPIATVMNALQTVNFTFMLGCFLFYFLTGYLLYGALFAAIGSAVDSETETQQFMLPITLPLVFAFMISVNYVVNFPDAPLSVWLSMIPLFAPVAMMVRLPFNPPLWQIGLSMLFMLIGFILTTMLAARIYRIGILMYGKKASFKELSKWIFYKD